MREGWREVRLEDVVTQHIDPINVEADELYANLGVQWYTGGTFRRAAKRGSEMKATRLFRVRPGQFVYNRMFVTEGSFALVAADHADGVVSNEFPLFDVNSLVALPDYLLLHFQQPSVWSEIATQATGTTKSRRRWKEQQFLAYRVAFPPLSAQRRIVDLVVSIDQAIVTAETESEQGTALLDALLNRTDTASSLHVGTVATISSGASWGKADLRTSEDGATRVLTIANTKPGGAVVGEPTYVAGLSQNVGKLTEKSIVAIRTNGNHDRIGNVYRIPDEYVGAAVSAFQLIIEPKNSADSAYLYWMLRRPVFQQGVSAAASGSTGLGNIAASKLREMSVPWPDDHRKRERLVVTFESLAGAVGAARAKADALRTLRSNLLTVLLSGEHEISASYDKLLTNNE